MDYRILKEKRILYCILDTIEGLSSTYSQETARNVSDFFLSILLRKKYDVVIGPTSDELLSRAATDDFYSHAVVVITGTHAGFSEAIINAVEKKCEEFFTVCGHILDRGDSYYEIHNQFFIVNLDEYRRLGCPMMGEMSWNTPHKKIMPVRSLECLYNDKELPVWVRPGTEEREYKNKRHGWNFFTVGLQNNAIFCDVGEEIRNKKTYLYYEYDHVFFRHVPDLFNYQLVCNTMVTPWNSDILPNFISIDEKSLDHYITTGTGLNWVYNLKRLGYHANTRITFTDISYPVLLFMKNLINDWDGEDYASFYMKQLNFMPISYNLDLTTHETRIREWFDNFEKEFEDFKVLWNDIKKLKFNYVLTDFFAPTDFSFINPEEVTFMNTSDAFNHVPYSHYAPLKYRVARENNLIKTLKQRHPNLWLFIPTRLGHIYQNNLTKEEEINFGRASDFNLWDINKFQCPPWQEKNWKSYCPLSGEVRILS